MRAQPCIGEKRADMHSSCCSSARRARRVRATTRVESRACRGGRADGKGERTGGVRRNTRRDIPVNRARGGA
eukprot:1161151-Pleurochrysis_carterae.AAC.1